MSHQRENSSAPCNFFLDFVPASARLPGPRQNRPRGTAMVSNGISPGESGETPGKY